MFRLWCDRALILLFVCGITAFGAASLMLPPDAESLANENRKPAPLPAIRPSAASLRKLPAQFETYFNDHIAFRESLLRTNAQIRFELGASPTDRVLLGDDGWLFLNEARSESTDGRWRDARAQAGLWASAIRKRARWLSERGIQYIVMLPPGKHDVYPEFVPQSARLGPRPSAADLLRGELRTDSAIRFVDVRSALLKARIDRLVYHRTDTHWNDAGAVTAYRALMERLAETWPELTSNDIEDFDTHAAVLSGDLARMIRMAGTQEESILAWSVRAPQARRLDVLVPLDAAIHSPRHLRPTAWGTGNAALPVAVLLHDSFADNVLVSALAEHFEMLVSAPTDSFDPGLIERFRPEVVIQEIVERKISWSTPVHPRGF